MRDMADPKHAFAVCAYGESPYLVECLESLFAQKGQESEIFISTSTPGAFLSETARRFGIPLYVNEGEPGIGQDWNSAYERADAPFVTIAHQDDVYCPEYAAAAVAALERDPASLIYFCDYGEIRDGIRVDDNRLLRVKRMLLRPLARGRGASTMRAKRKALRFGSSICCPSVTFNVANCPRPPFVVGMRSNLDWATWEALSRRRGSFLYDDAILMYHRVHAGSATTRLIASHERDEEDLAMLEKFWPHPVARAIERVYALGTKSNSL